MEFVAKIYFFVCNIQNHSKNFLYKNSQTGNYEDDIFII